MSDKQNYTNPEYWDDKLPNLAAVLREIKKEKMKNIEEITEEDLLAIWPVIGGEPHLFEYGKDELRSVLITGYNRTGIQISGDEEDEFNETISLQLDFYTMAAIVDTLRSRGFETPDYVNTKLIAAAPDLLSALQSAFDPNIDTNTLDGIFKAAIKKATE